MGSITLDDISKAITFLVAFIGGVEYLYHRIKTTLKKALNDEFEPIEKEILEVKKENQNNELQMCMNYLVIAIEKAKKDKYMSDVEKQRFYEVLDVYTNKYHKNSYIHNEVLDLEKTNIL